jgi:hypothetical protein
MFSQSHVLAGVFGTITSVGWTVQVLFGGWLFKTVWEFKNKNEGISFQNVRARSGWCARYMGEDETDSSRGVWLGLDWTWIGDGSVQGGELQDGCPASITDLGSRRVELVRLRTDGVRGCVWVFSCDGIWMGLDRIVSGRLGSVCLFVCMGYMP